MHKCYQMASKDIIGSRLPSWSWARSAEDRPYSDVTEGCPHKMHGNSSNPWVSGSLSKSATVCPRAGVSCCWACLNLSSRTQTCSWAWSRFCSALNTRCKSARVDWSCSWRRFSIKWPSSTSTASSSSSSDAESGDRMTVLVRQVLVAVVVDAGPGRDVTSDAVVAIASSHQGLVLPLSQNSTSRNSVRNQQSADGDRSGCEGQLRTCGGGGGISGGCTHCTGFSRAATRWCREPCWL